MPAPALGVRVVEAGTKDRELCAAADERRFEPTRNRGRARDHVDEPPGADGLLPSQRERFERLGVDGAAHEPQRAGPEHDLARVGCLCEAPRNLHRRPGDARPACRIVRGEYFAGVDTETQLDVLAERADLVAQLDHSANSP